MAAGSARANEGRSDVKYVFKWDHRNFSSATLVLFHVIIMFAVLRVGLAWARGGGPQALPVWAPPRVLERAVARVAVGRGERYR